MAATRSCVERSSSPPVDREKNLFIFQGIRQYTAKNSLDFIEQKIRFTLYEVEMFSDELCRMSVHLTCHAIMLQIVTTRLHKPLVDLTSGYPNVNDARIAVGGPLVSRKSATPNVVSVWM